MTTIILSLQSGLALFTDARGRYDCYEHTYWNYLVIRSWLFALAGITAGVIFFWIGSRFKSKDAVLQNKTCPPHLAAKRIASIICLAVGAILMCIYCPGVSDYLGRNALYDDHPIQPSPQSASMVFMVMSNDLATSRVEFSPLNINNIKLQMPVETTNRLDVSGANSKSEAAP